MIKPFNVVSKKFSHVRRLFGYNSIKFHYVAQFSNDRFNFSNVGWMFSHYFVKDNSRFFFFFLENHAALSSLIFI